MKTSLTQEIHNWIVVKKVINQLLTLKILVPVILRLHGPLFLLFVIYKNGCISLFSLFREDVHFLNFDTLTARVENIVSKYARRVCTNAWQLERSFVFLLKECYKLAINILSSQNKPRNEKYSTAPIVRIMVM